MSTSCKEYQRLYYLKNKERKKQKVKERYNLKKSEIISQEIKYRRDRRKNDSFFKLKHNIRSLISMSLRQRAFVKNSKTADLLCCSMEELRLHIESQFDSEMNWDNYASVWTYDHICPCDQAENEKELILLQHYTNIRPYKENRLKSNNRTPEADIMCQKLLKRTWKNKGTKTMGKITINQDSLKTRREWKRHKIKEGSNVYRFLPPFGDVEVHNNYPYKKWSTVWLVDPKTGTRRPFSSPLTDGNKDCPVKDYNDKLTKHIDKLKAQYQTKGLSEDKIKDKLKAIREVQWGIKVQHVYAYNACDKSGEVGILELKSTAHQGVKKGMNQYIKDYSQDPTSLGSDLKNDSGVWFCIIKEGEGKNTEYNVTINEIKKKNSDGELEKRDDRSALPDNVVENYDDLGYDLNAIYPRKTYDELMDILLYNLAIIAEDCPEAVLPGYDVSGISINAKDDDEGEEPEEEQAPPVKKAAAPKVTLQLDDDDEDEEPVKKTAAPTKTAPPKASKARMSDEDVMAMADDILGL